MDRNTFVKCHDDLQCILHHNNLKGTSGKGDWTEKGQDEKEKRRDLRTNNERGR